MNSKREELRRVMIRAEREWPGNLEKRMEMIEAVFKEEQAPTSDEREELIRDASKAVDVAAEPELANRYRDGIHAALRAAGGVK